MRSPVTRLGVNHRTIVDRQPGRVNADQRFGGTLKHLHHQLGNALVLTAKPVDRRCDRMTSDGMLCAYWYFITKSTVTPESVIPDRGVSLRVRLPFVETT